MVRASVPLAALALVLVVVGCGDGGEILTDRGPFGTPEIFCHASPPLCPTETPTPVYQPAKATISCLTISRTPGGPCPTWTPLPN